MAAPGGGYQYKHLTASGLVTGQPQARLHTVVCNNVAATAVITLADSASASTTPAIAIITAPAAGLAGQTMRYDLQVANGLYVTIATAAADITVTYE